MNSLGKSEKGGRSLLVKGSVTTNLRSCAEHLLREACALLLDLMTAEHVGKADPRGWTERLRVELVSRGGAAPGQRPHDDAAQRPSLLS